MDDDETGLCAGDGRGDFAVGNPLFDTDMVDSMNFTLDDHDSQQLPNEMIMAQPEVQYLMDNTLSGTLEGGTSGLQGGFSNIIANLSRVSHPLLYGTKAD